ncbi:MAG: M6 family metalloprotease domain-containing protein [Prevotella sp.]|nr:M6 family metalloprotease domain-containing protein [Prevotella sp.]
MKRAYLLFVIALFGCIVANAVPAKGNLVKVKQPDGSEVSIRLVGDEYLHFNTTADGYSVVRDNRGYFVYAERSASGKLVPTAQVAHNAETRDVAENAFLSNIQKYIQPEMETSVAEEKTRERERRLSAQERHSAPSYDYTKFRGLVILVEYNDRSFDHPNYKDVITETITKEGFTGYYDYNNRWVNCTGSVFDYYKENSMGAFMPQFDVVGPILVDQSQYYAEGTSNATQLIYDVVNAADEEVDFSQYDGDGDGYVDMVYFIFAGHGANVGGNNSGLIWPHASQVYNPNGGGWNWQVRKDGVVLGRYACSTELAGSDGSYGYNASRTIDGIGTICHEFTHVLGLPDFYDADYSGSGGESNTPGDWTLMASGCYNNYSRTPAGYSLFERYAVGFATPEVIEGEGSYTIENLYESNSGYRINSGQNKEFFILENRQQERWDQYLPGHGLLIFRVDSTSTRVWTNNTVNNNPKHNYYELVRACGVLGSGGYDPFPGRGKVTAVNNTTTPANLLSWGGKETQWGLLNIKESKGVISFDIEDTYVLRNLTLPEEVVVGLGHSRQLVYTAEPSYAKYELTWKSADENVATVDSEGLVKGVALGITTITLESDNGLVAECKIEVKELPVYDNIGSVRALEEQTEGYVNLTDAQVLYVDDGDIYLRDASAAIVLRGTNIEAKQNDILNGTLYGCFTKVNRMPYFNAVENITTTEEVKITIGSEVEPRHVKFGELTEADYADMLSVDTVQLVYENKSIFAIESDNKARLFNNFAIKNIKAPNTVDNKYFQVTCIFGTHVVNDEVIDELYLLGSPVEVEVIDTGIESIQETISGQQVIDAIYDLQGRRVKATELRKGIYIINGRKVAIQ